MKKSLLALAVLGAFAGAASAQSTVTLYGLVDLNVSNYKYGNSFTGDTTITKLTDGTVNGLNGSRWGLRVIEDLGGGLKAGATLESGFAPDTGALNQGGRLFGRQSFLFLSGGFGEIRAGRQYALHDEVLGATTNPFANGLVLNPGLGVTTKTGSTLIEFVDAPRIDNVVQYLTPSFGGFVGQISLAPGEGVNDRYQGLKGSYTGGPVAAALSYEWNKSRAATTTTAIGDNTNKVITLGASYDLGVVKLMGGYQRGTDLSTAGGNVGAISSLAVPSHGAAAGFAMDKVKAYTVGVSAPVGVFLLGANYSRMEYEKSTAPTAKATLGKVGVGATYALSKVTFLYGGLSVATGDLKDEIQEKRVLQFGLRKAF